VQLSGVPRNRGVDGIVSRRPGNIIGWIFCAIGLGTAATSFSAEYVQHALAMHADTQVATGLLDVMAIPSSC
jgi:hypothetical protein